jgi:site-specific DNA-methyltransferase (adenine-specific)
MPLNTPLADALTAVIIHGDCRDLLSMTGTVDAVVTDPPYGIGAKASVRRSTTGQRKIGMPARMWDNEAPDLSFLMDVAPIVAIWGGNYFALPQSRGWLAWCKPDAPPSMGSLEMCWTNQDRTAKHIVHSISATNKERVGHPTQKPIAVMLRTLEFLKLPPNSLIMDPYCGSGTTGVAAIKAGHRFIGIERESGYVAIARQRIADARAQLTLGAA